MHQIRLVSDQRMLCFAIAEMLSWFDGHNAAKLARHTIACVAFLADLVYYKRNELPDQIVPFTIEKRGEGWKSLIGGRKYESLPFLSRKAQPVVNGSWRRLKAKTRSRNRSTRINPRLRWWPVKAVTPVSGWRQRPWHALQIGVGGQEASIVNCYRLNVGIATRIRRFRYICLLKQVI